MDIPDEGLHGIYSKPGLPWDQAASMETPPLSTPRREYGRAWGGGWEMVGQERVGGGRWYRAGEGGEGVALGHWSFLQGRQEIWGEDRALAGEKDCIGVLDLPDTLPSPRTVTLGMWPPSLGL